MNIRILSFAALAGMLTAAGCGGGTGSGIAPSLGNSTNGGTGVPTSKARGTLSASFLVPQRYVKQGSSSSSSSRKPSYISPGSSGIEVLLGVLTGSTVSNMSWIIGSQGSPVALVAKPGVSFAGNTLTANQAGGAAAVVSYSYQNSTVTGFYIFTVSITGLAPNSGNTYEVGVVLTDITHKNFVLSSGQAAAATQLTSSSGPVSVALTLTPVLAGAYLVGPTYSAGTATSAGLLGANATGAQDSSLGVATAGYEFTAYPTDELGYVIPTQSTVPTSFLNTTSWGPSVAAASNLVLNSYTQATASTAGDATVVAPGVASSAVPFGTSTNPIPTALSLGVLSTTTAIGTRAFLTAANAAGAAGAISFTAPGTTVAIANPAGSNPNQPPNALVGSTISSGQAFYVTGASGTTGAVNLNVAYNVLSSTNTSTPSGFVTGYSYVPGTNLPATALSTTLATSTVSFTPSIIPVIQSKIRH